MKWKLLSGGVLIVACVGLLAIKGSSQVPSSIVPASFNSPSPPSFPTDPRREKTFEQLAEDLETVRAKQKELQAQEEDILKRMDASVEAKRKDLEKAEAVLQSAKGQPRQRELLRIKPEAKR